MITNNALIQNNIGAMLHYMRVIEEDFSIT